MSGSARGPRRLGLGVLVAALCLSASPSLSMEETEVGAVSKVERLQAQETETRLDLEALGSAITVTGETIESLDAEIRGLAEDRSAIRQSMIETAEKQKQLAREIAAVERRIVGLAGQESDVRASLRERRGLLAEVLGALQRMGRKPPPALLVRPDDALGSVRSAILLGSVVPAIRSETEALALELAELARLQAAIEAEKGSFTAGLTLQREEEARLARLFEEKERLEAGSREALDGMNQRAAELASEASTLQDLIVSLEGDLQQARDAEAAARLLAERQAEQERIAAAKAEAERVATAERAEAERREVAALAATEVPPEPAPTPEPEVQVAALEPPNAAPEPVRPTYDIASLRREMARLEPVAAFSTMKGILSRPVIGEVKHAFGKDDGLGRASNGMTFRARASDLVTSPAEGQVLYSGPFRSYGQLLILNVGDGYHIVLAGMSEIDVDVGQFVLAGEPVAVMGARRLASADGSDVASTEPSLYVEFRKDGKPVDPTPWWTDGSSGRTGNDT